jgi:hypothetical protein
MHFLRGEAEHRFGVAICGRLGVVVGQGLVQATADKGGTLAASMYLLDQA